jgi:parvulin-like peptidyl-prolyl isomerase
MTKDIMKFRGLFFTVYGFILVSLLSCASIPSESAKIAAYVDNDPITIGDIEYSLQVAHRKEGLSKTEGINISEYLNKVINERLLVHEARLIGMDLNPELIHKVDAYVLRESVSRLYNEEILDKVTVSEEEIIGHFKKEYEQYTLSSIETGTAEDAGIILAKLKGGMDFGMLAREFAEHEFRKGVEEATFVRKDLSKEIKDVIDSLEPGEISDVFEAGHRYYLIHLINRQNALEEGLKETREDIKQAIRKNKVQERSEEYLGFLIRKMKPDINHEVLSLIPLDGSREELSTWLQDKSALVKLRDSTLTVGEFAGMLRPGKGKSKDIIIKQWIDRQAVDYEALDRKYNVNSDLKEKTIRYKNKMLMKMFINKVLSPGVEISEDDLLEFYQNNQYDFTRPSKYKVQQITLKTESEADEIKKELIKGADFSWMAKNRSFDNYASVGGTTGWRVKDQLPEELKEVVIELEPGEISDVMISGDFFRIYRVQEKTDKKVEEFERVRPAVHKKVFSAKYKELYDSYLDKLKKEADVKFNDEVVRDLDHMINNGKSS